MSHRPVGWQARVARPPAPKVLRQSEYLYSMPFDSLSVSVLLGRAGSHSSCCYAEQTLRVSESPSLRVFESASVLSVCVPIIESIPLDYRPQRPQHRKHVVEEDDRADGHDPALLQVPCHRRQSAADGAVRRETIDWYGRVFAVPQCSVLSVTYAGTLFRASQFLSEELPIRLAHRVQELGDLPDGLNEMPSIKRVQDWYAQSFEVSRRHYLLGFCPTALQTVPP